MPDIYWEKNAVVGVSASTAGFSSQRQAEESMRVLQTQLLHKFYPQDILDNQVEEVLYIVFIDHLWHLILPDTLREQ